MGSHVPRVATIPCKDCVVGLIPTDSTNVNAPVAQLVEATSSDLVQCEFESPPGVPKLWSGKQIGDCTRFEPGRA